MTTMASRQFHFSGGTILPIATIGDPVLRKENRQLTRQEIESPQTQSLIRDLVATMHDAEGIGIAAPQIAVSRRVAIIELASTSERYPDMGEFPLTVFINPKVTVLDEQPQNYWEGCLSVPGMRGLVTRPGKVRVDYLNEQGHPCTLEASGFPATVVQHELDHLDGVLFTDRMDDMTKLVTLDNYRRFWAGAQPELD